VKTFSYKTSLFKTFLAVSALAHLTVLGWGHLFQLEPKFAVKQAPSSLEIVILEEEVLKKQKKPIEKVITAKKPLPQMPEVKQEKQKIERVEETKPTVITPPLQGALDKAKPDYLKNPAPHYPRIAREQGWEGVVLLKVHVTEAGAADQILVEKSSGHRVLDQSAVRAVRKWKFLPAKVGRIPMASWIEIPVRFILED